MADDEYNRKLESLQQYIPFLNNMINQLKDPRKKNREQQLNKMQSLHDMITDKKKKLKLDTLIKCEDVILKLYEKVKSGPQSQLLGIRPIAAPMPVVAPPRPVPVPPPKLQPVPPPKPQPVPPQRRLVDSSPASPPITPSSPSPPRDILKTKPVVIPTEKVTKRDSSIVNTPSSGAYKTKIDVYSSAADSLKSKPTTSFNVPLVPSRDMSKPPISIEDLEALQADALEALNADPPIDTERMSLNELTDLKEQLQKELCDKNGKKSESINTTVRNTTILTKKAVEKEKQEEKKPPKTPTQVKQVKVVKESDSIFGSALSSIDNRILEGTKVKDRRSSIASSSSSGSKKDEGEKERRSSKDERSHKSSKDKSDKKSSETKDMKDKYKDKTKKNEHKDKSKDEHKDKSKDEHKDKSKDEKEKAEPKEGEREKPKDPRQKPQDDKPMESPKPTFKRLADKYNPKPRKPSIEATAEVPKSVSESIENSMKNVPATIPFIDPPVQHSAPKPVPPPQMPINLPLLSPSNSIDSEVAGFSRKAAPPQIPPQVSNILSNPDATAIINNVVNQLKGRQTPLLGQHPNQMNFNQGNFQNNRHYNDNNQMAQPFWGNKQGQNYQQNSFGPNQGNNMDFYAAGRSATPASFNNFNQGQQMDKYERAPSRLDYNPPDDCLFGSRDRDMRYNRERDPDWRRERDNHWSRDPRMQNKDPRSYRDDSRSYSRDYDRGRDSRSNYRDGRDPRVNRRDSYGRDRPSSRQYSREQEDTFASPLNSLYGGDGYKKTGKGYGVQNYKIPKVKKDEEGSKSEPKQEGESEPKKEEVIAETSKVKDDEKPKTEEAKEEEVEEVKNEPKRYETRTRRRIIESDDDSEEETKPAETASVSVSSTTECHTIPAIPKKESEVSEISSTNDIEAETHEEAKKPEPNQADVLKEFIKQLLKNENTRAAASLFIDNVSDSLDDERLKTMVQTVKALKTEEENVDESPSASTSAGPTTPKKKKKTNLTMLSARQKRIRKKRMDLRKKQEEKIEEEPEAESVVVTVGERIKRNRRRIPAKKKKHKSELDLLHEDIQDMFIRDGVLTATGKRMCRLLKSETDTSSATRRTRSTAERFDSKTNSDRLKAMSSVRVLLPKISVENLEVDEDGKRYSLRRSKGKSYAENDSDEDKHKEKRKRQEVKAKEESEDDKEEEEVVEEEVEKAQPVRTPSPPKKVRKRLKSSWASGVIPKRKKIAKDDKIMEDEPEADKTVELIEPDKDYYTDRQWNYKMSCKLCSYKGPSISKHYRVNHTDSEVLSSRLSPNRAVEAIRQSSSQKLDEIDEMILASTLCHEFKCRFCDLEMYAKPPNFYDHISVHTGEYRHNCSVCPFVAGNSKAIRVHYEKEHNKERDTKSFSIKTQIYGYICTECNYVQMDKKGVENHVNIYHLGEGKKVVKINLSTVPPRRRKEKVTEDSFNESFEKDDEENEEPLSKRARIEELEELDDDEPEVEKEKEPQPPPREIDMTVFTCGTDMQEENEKIEQERLKKMTELNDTVKTNRQSLNFVEQLSNRLRQQLVKTPEVVIKSEPLEPEPEIEPETVFELPQAPKKPSKVVETASASAKVEVVHKENTLIRGMIAKLQGILKEEVTDEEPVSVDTHIANSVKTPPPLYRLEEKPTEDKSLINTGFLTIYTSVNSWEYECRVPSCLFSTDNRERFLTHWSEDHTKINQSYRSTKCRLCSADVVATIDKTLLSNFFDHVEKNHLQTNQPNILKPRRLSGDILSCSKDEEIAEKVDDEVSDSNFSFKIADVFSLAENPIPPLSPIEKPVAISPKLMKTVMGHTILKESKLTLMEQTSKWKSEEAHQRFMERPRDLYKCPQMQCKFSTNYRHTFEKHIGVHSDVGDEPACCVYCNVKTPLNHSGVHIDFRHSNCLYSCSQCLYRALTREYVVAHMKLKHQTSDKIIPLPPKTDKSVTMGTQRQYVPKDVCVPFRCGVPECEDVKFLFERDFLRHLTMDHTGLTLNCGMKNCGFFVYGPENMIKHWRSHGYYRYHCLWCIMGTKDTYEMLQHYATNHPNKEPLVIDRSSSTNESKSYTYDDEAFEHIRYVNEEILESINDSAEVTTVRPTNPPKVDSPKNITIFPLSILQGTSPAKNEKKLIAIIPAKSVARLPAQTVKLLTTGGITEVRSIETATVDTPSPSTEEPTFIFASTEGNVKEKDGEDVDSRIENRDPLTLDMTADDSDSQDINEVCTEKSYGLIREQLYRCAFCDISFTNPKDFKNHCVNSKLCKTGDSDRPFKCVHCNRLCKQAHGLIEHLHYHGPLRFSCSLCCNKFPSSFSLRLHMRKKHNVVNTVTTPMNPKKSDLDKDEFILRPKPAIDQEQGNEGQTAQSRFAKDAFLPTEIDELPKRYIFSSELKCAICSYKTKVRTNLVRHLMFHSAEKSVPETAPVNPVPCLDKNEKMFDKMTNLAISSFATGRMGGTAHKSKTEQPEESNEMPAYVPQHRRYVCRANGCNYLCLEESNLRQHLFAFHQNENVFPCAHCSSDLKTDLEGFLKHLKLHDLHLYKCPHCNFFHNLKHKVDKHSTDRHPEKNLPVTTVRALEAESLAGEKPVDVATQPSTSGTVKWAKPWHCGMCKYRSATKEDILTHIVAKHDINAQFKCTLCNYKSDEKGTFESHFRELHPDNEIDVIYVYNKRDGVVASGTRKEFDTTPLWQRDRPRVRHIRGILFEDSSPTKLKKIVRELATLPRFNPGPSTSTNLDLAIDAVAKGLDDASSSKTDKHEDVIVIDDEDMSEDVDVEETPIEVKSEVVRTFISENILVKKYGKLCAPLGKTFRCPICYKVKTKKVSCFVYHLLQELQTYRFKCKACSFQAVTFDAISSHCQEEHDGAITANVEDIPLEKSLEYWLQLLIRHQAVIMAGGNGQKVVGEDVSTPGCKVQCEYCSKWFKNTHLMKEHEVQHWADHQYNCGHCSLEFTNLDHVFQHTYTSHPNSECSFTTYGPYVGSIIATLKTSPVSATGPSTTQPKVNTDVYLCAYCDHVEKSCEILHKHYKECHDSETNKFRFTVVDGASKITHRCSYCHEKGSGESLRRHHSETHSNLKFAIYQLICLECSGTFMSPKELKSHFAKCHTNKRMVYSVIDKATQKDQYTCTRCPFRTHSEGLIRQHARKHIRPVDCKICGATFLYPTEGRQHHAREHNYTAEAVEANEERHKEFEDMVQEILRKGAGGKTVPVKKMYARKSTGAAQVKETNA